MAAPLSLVTGAFIGTSNTNLYTSPIGTSTMISKFTLTNVTGEGATVTVYLSSGAVTNAEAPLQTVTVPANTTVVLSTVTQHVVPPLGALLAGCSAADTVIAKISGVQFSA